MTLEQLTLRAIQTGVSLYCLLIASQALVEYDRYTSGGLLSPDISKLQFNKYWQRRGFELAFSHDRFKYVVYAHLCGGIILGYQSIINNIPTWPLLLVLFTTILIGIRHHAGLNGTYQISLVSILGLLWASVASNPLSIKLALAFIAVQATLSYTVSGLLKIPMERWRSGEVITDMADSEIWVSDIIARGLDAHQWLVKPLSWFVIITESFFVVVLFAPREVAIVILLGGVLFHGLNAIAMGLNSFLIIFPSTYPSIYYINRIIHTSVYPLFF